MSQTSQPIDDRRYYPMLFVGVGVADAVAVLDRIWAIYKTLPSEKKSILLSDELPEKIKALQDAFRLDGEAVGQITVLIRKIFFGELAMAECEAKIGSMLATTNGGDPHQAKAIVEFIQKEILTIRPTSRAEEEAEEKPKAVMVHLPLLQALSQYENLGNQLITEARIRVKSQPEPVRPSLLYWIKYYRDELGVGHHDSVQRGQFLFRSENGKKLSAEERERVGLILKSVEENFPLSIDTEHQEIIFPAFQGVMTGHRQEPPAIPSNARITRGPEFFNAAAENERIEKKFVPAPRSATNEPQMRREMDFDALKPAAPVDPGVIARNPVGQEGDAGTISFSTHHVFPAEKEAGDGQTLPSAPPALKSKHNPFHIDPVSLGKRNKK